MKIHSRSDQRHLEVSIDGAIDSSKCDCLSRYWDFYIASDLPELYVSMENVDEIDPTSVATMVNLLRETIVAGTQITLSSPPQVLAHTLYKARLLEGENAVIVENPRMEEPYAG